MTSQTPAAAAGDAGHRDRAALAYVCEHLHELRRYVHDTEADPDAGEPQLLDELIDALATGRPVTPVLDAIDAALRRAGDALGLYHGQRSVQLPGIQPRMPGGTLYLCPSRQCDRSTWAQLGPVPRCAFSGRPLREERL